MDAALNLRAVWVGDNKKAAVAHGSHAGVQALVKTLRYVSPDFAFCAELQIKMALLHSEERCTRHVGVIRLLRMVVHFRMGDPPKTAMSQVIPMAHAIPQQNSHLGHIVRDIIFLREQSH